MPANWRASRCYEVREGDERWRASLVRHSREGGNPGSVGTHGGAQVATGSDCAMPKEPPVRDACDAFKAVGVQSLSSAQLLSDGHLQVVVSEQISVPISDQVLSRPYAFSGSPLFLDRDPLSLTSILRI